MNELKKALHAEPLSQEEAKRLMNRIMEGQLTPAQTAGVLMALRTRGETVEEISGFALAMREHAVHVDVGLQPLFDIVGTGGDGAGTFNISTTAAFVLAAGGLTVAKHGNRAASSKSGSADVLEALGVRLDLDAHKNARVIQEAGIGFLFARTHHPAMRNVAAVRSELGVRTAFNLLGPLTNPAGATHLLLGVFSSTWLQPLAEVLRALGTQAAMVVHGEGTDELTLGENQVALLQDGSIEAFRLVPEDVGLEQAPLSALRGGDPSDNARFTRAILAGQERGPKRDVVALNAGAGFFIAELAPSLEAGVRKAEEILNTGLGHQVLSRLVRLSNAPG